MQHPETVVINGVIVNKEDAHLWEKKVEQKPVEDKPVEEKPKRKPKKEAAE